jgi:hypothetical protein
MQGKEVFNFPEGDCYFFKDGSVFFSDLDEKLRLFGPDGLEQWAVNEFGHHDFDVSEDEQEIFVVTSERKQEGDKKLIHHYVLGFSKADGREIFRWDSEKYFEQFKDLGIQVSLHDSMGDLEYYHINSVQVLPPNRWEKTIPAFRRGNVLINCFDNGVAFIIDRQNMEIAWWHAFDAPTEGDNADAFTTAGSHTVKLLENGHILYMANVHKYELAHITFSSIEEIDPSTHQVVWRYMANPATDFNVPIWGSVYRLHNGNTLVTRSPSGSAFEVTRDGRIVWEWFNPERDPFGLARSVYRVRRIPKKRLDPVINKWRGIYSK